MEVARTIATREELLLVDEPCAELSPSGTAAMVDGLRRIRTQGVAVVLVERDMPSVTEVHDLLLALDAGWLIADGTPADVAADAPVIAAYLDTPQGED